MHKANMQLQSSEKGKEMHCCVGFPSDCTSLTSVDKNYQKVMGKQVATNLQRVCRLIGMLLSTGAGVS